MRSVSAWLQLRITLFPAVTSVNGDEAAASESLKETQGKLCKWIFSGKSG